jgi:hypothetical protein
MELAELTKEERAFLLEKTEKFKSGIESIRFIELLTELQREFGERSLEAADIILEECNTSPCPHSNSIRSQLAG